MLSTLSKLYLLQRLYQRFRISLDNFKITNFRDLASDKFVSWSQTTRSSEIGQNLKVLFLYNAIKSGSIR